MREWDSAQLERGWQVAQSIVQSLRSPGILPTIYPALFARGVAEGSLHSYMLSALLLLGDRLGYSAVVDSPVFDRLDNLLLGEGSKRPDSVWFDRGTETTQVLIEFERYTTSSLEQKARNLLIMANACVDDITLLVLMYWTLEVRSQSDLQAACGLAERGFRARGSRFGRAPCPMMLLETIVKRRGECLSIDSFVVRQFVFGGESKRYIAENLNKLDGLGASG